MEEEEEEIMGSNSQDICWLSIFLQFTYLFIYSSPPAISAVIQ